MVGPLDDAPRRAGVGTLLQTLRLVLISFIVALLAIGVVVAVIAEGVDADSGRISSTVAAGGIMAFGLASLVLVRLIEPRLDCTSDSSLIVSYRNRFFLRVALAEAVALLGFAAVFLTGDAWLYPLGGAITAIGFLRLAPTERNLERDQDTLNEQGCGRSLRAVLGSATTAG